MLGYLKRVSTLRPLIFHFEPTLIFSSTTPQCDEAHPTCNNCLKSKRECLGYDPVFRAQPGPAAIQPAPSSAPAMHPITSTSAAYPPPPQGYMPASSQPFAPGLTADATSPDSSAEQFDGSNQSEAMRNPQALRNDGIVVRYVCTWEKTEATVRRKAA